MKYFDRTFPTPQANLACDEALLDWCEDGQADEILRFWEARQPFVVLGYSNKARAEVNLDSCRALNVPVLRRCSGGGTVLQGPGCLNYALILRIQDSTPLASISDANAFIMNRQREALNPLLAGKVLIQGHTDLTVLGRKFSGNSQRRKRRFLLFHGSLLLDCDLNLVEKTLSMPTKQPTYRQQRSHLDFLTNLHLAPAVVKDALRQAWNATDSLDQIPADRIESLATGKYSSDEWTYRV